MDNRIIDVIEALEKAKRYGILQPEDVDKQLKMNLEKYIEAQFLLCDATLKVSYLASNKMYRIRVPLKVQKELGLRPQYFGGNRSRKTRHGRSKSYVLFWVEEPPNSRTLYQSRKNTAITACYSI